MDIWERLYEAARELYHPQDVSPFVYAHHVACALESENGDIYTGFCVESCSGVMNLCAERVAALNMYLQSGQTKIRRLLAFRDAPPSGGGSGMPCGACREFLMQLDEANEDTEILVDYANRQTVKLGELLPNWWGRERYEQARIQTAIDRIRSMEALFDSLLERQDRQSSDYALLQEYYHGGQWQQDYELDEQGKLPEDLKRGVLSQDAVYLFLTE